MNVGSIAWKTLTGQSVVNVSVAKPQDLMQVARRNDLDMSHMPDDATSLSDADRMALEEQKANKHLKSFYAAGTVFENTVRFLGGLGSTWGMIQGLMGSGPTGWVAVAAGAGSALTVTDATFQVKMAAVNRNLPAAIDGSFTMVQGMGVLLTAMGMGRAPALVAVGAVIGKMGYGMYRSVKDEKEKEEAKKADEARKAAEKAARQTQAQPAQPAVAPAPVQGAQAPAVPVKSA